MRNLKLVESVGVGDVAGLSDVQCTCIDYDTKALYCATATGIVEFDPSKRQASSHPHNSSLRNMVISTSNQHVFGQFSTDPSGLNVCIH